MLVLCETDAAGRVTWSDDMERARRMQAYEEAKPMTLGERIVAVLALLAIFLVGVATVADILARLWP